MQALTKNITEEESEMKIWMLSLLLLANVHEVTDQNSLNIVATAVRHHGYKCTVPQKMERLKTSEKSGPYVWFITCDKNKYHYRVKFISGNKSIVEKID